jgi:segregation and condensation protein B
MDADLIRRIVEAALLAAGQPLNLAQLVALFPEDDPPEPGSIERALESLREESGQRGFELVEVASGFRFQIRAEVQPWVGRLWAERQTRYSRAQLETLALIAYRQPITRGEIEQIRGVAVSSHIVRTLEDREWIRVVGHRDVPGKPALYGTTRAFLDYFNLKSLDQLPPLSELHEIPDLDPQLSLDAMADAMPAAAREVESTPPDGGSSPAGDETSDQQDAAPESADSAPGEILAPEGAPSDHADDRAQDAGTDACAESEGEAEPELDADADSPPAPRDHAGADASLHPTGSDPVDDDARLPEQNP